MFSAQVGTTGLILLLIMLMSVTANVVQAMLLSAYQRENSEQNKSYWSLLQRHRELLEKHYEGKQDHEKLLALVHIAMHPDEHDAEIYHECFGEIYEKTRLSEFVKLQRAAMCGESEAEDE